MKLALLLVCLALLAPAEAVSFPGESPFDGQGWAEVNVALKFWQARSVTGCPGGVAAQFADDLYDARDGMFPVERGGDCRIFLSWPELSPYRKWAASPHARVRRLALRTECSYVVHGVGHALGLEHTASGVMAAVVTTIPWDCAEWARSVWPLEAHRPDPELPVLRRHRAR